MRGLFGKNVDAATQFASAGWGGGGFVVRGDGDLLGNFADFHGERGAADRVAEYEYAAGAAGGAGVGACGVADVLADSRWAC